MTRHPRPRALAAVLPYLWLAIFFLLPLLILLKISLAEPANARPPYLPLFLRDADGAIAIAATLRAYRLIFADSLYLGVIGQSVRIALTCTAICLVIGYPMAYAIARAPHRWRTPLLLIVILPFWTSFVVRVYAWMGLLRPRGLVNGLLQWLGLIDQPLALMNNHFAVHLGIVYGYLPFMVLALYAAIERCDRTLLEAAADLGTRPLRAFLAITLPLTAPGIAAGCLVVFIPAVGEFVVPDLLGGPDTLMIGKLVWSEFFQNRDWPAASALAIVLLVLLIVPVILLERRGARTGEAPQ